MQKIGPFDGSADEIRIYSEAQAADFLGMSRRTLQNMRQTGDGPAFVKISARRVGYSLSSLKTWVASRSVQSTAQATVRFGGAA
ncbi:helix-turn-helix domain-containing protein [Acetobacter senegalensis]|uniref:helix-turn-helix transcriptional regulator n=1 Tax=Acetobacter senegalensis TaxID=446692 RepID=UPI0022AA52FC|nr:helix-turn-helix domain-containing protein [Acetobacter senegalensis]MCG4260281.1 helix-turn-helix domain-containing protein [Acetobacter senegalensis]